MMPTPLPDRKQWNALPVREAEALLMGLLQTHLTGFELKRFERFSKFGMETRTMVLDHDGCEFVFVPGDTVTLGLDRWTFAPKNKQRLLAQFQKFAQTNDEAALDQYIRERMSPVRTVTIGPMLVECAARETGYFPVSLDDERLVQGYKFDEILAEVRNSEKKTHTYTVNDEYRLNKTEAGIQAFLYEPASYDELVADVVRGGWRLPTEDEWEYLCGGGTRTLYPWGNDLDDTQSYKHFNTGRPDAPLYLEAPNHFGLVIANDPYHYEVMMESEYFLKGGDGGCNICGGMGMALGWLPTSTYFRDITILDPELIDWKNEITGDYTFTRRILHL